MRSTTAALSPMWSQCRWVLTTKLQRPASLGELLGEPRRRDGVAVSMASASRLASSPSTTDVGGDRTDDPLQQLHAGEDSEPVAGARPRQRPGASCCRSAVLRR